MASDVKVVINLKQPTGKIGFGYPLVFEGKATKAVDYTECAKLDEVAKAGFAETTNVYKAAQRIFAQTNAPSKIAVCATTDNAVTGIATVLTKGWRQLVVASIGTEGESTVEEIATFIETTTDKLYFASVSELTDITPAISKFERTIVMYYTDTSVVCPEAALVGETAGKKAGSFTYKNQILKGLDPLELSTAELATAHAKNCYSFVTMAGDNVTTEGKVLSGEYADIIDSKDYIISQLTYQLQKALNSNDKITYDNNGIALLENICVSVLQDAYNNGIIAETEDGKASYSVEFAARNATKAEDRKARKYVEGKFNFSLRGAIHEIEVTGTIEI